MRLKGQSAVITGGGSGIGLATAVALAGQGCRVLIAGRDEAKLREAAASHNTQPPLEIHVVDVADRASVEKLFAWVREEFGTLDILVNGAGINIKRRTMGEMDPADWDRVLAINATGAYNCLREALALMRPRRQGLVFNISSTSGKRAAELGGVAYCASKFAMSALGTAAGAEEAKNGIRITNIFPGEVDTPILMNRPVPVTDEHRATILQPEDVADLVLALCLLPPRAHVPELVIKPVRQVFV
jgi:NAD(P)-dependent dehydrogenase (short-subunit alcohol dehydrogenase family)